MSWALDERDWHLCCTEHGQDPGSVLGVYGARRSSEVAILGLGTPEVSAILAGACSSSVAEAAQACRAQASPRWPEGGSAQHLLLLDLGGNVVLLVGDLQVGDEQHGDALPLQLLHMSYHSCNKY